MKNKVKETNIEIKTNISPSEKVQFVKFVYEACKENDGIYIPIVKQTLFNFALISYFTNYNLESVSGNFDKIYALVNGTNIIGKIEESVKPEILTELKYNVDRYFERPVENKENIIYNKISDILDNISKVTQEMSSDSFISFINNFSMFANDYSAENILNIFSSHKDLFAKKGKVSDK